ncbi:hypothetical protein PCC7424_0374 [Gloeothece citriformis PCC 7424]|uniref:Uncharacterized protein n=1 Tax=Gloeothece citriformis (strain PCC 7424) TaxID=65393 RepID=B7KC18_GLOC7|nr:hypothetical protein PCC7424_0374 [Gloeothece citriformis PCC 7424]
MDNGQWIIVETSLFILKKQQEYLLAIASGIHQLKSLPYPCF